MAIGIQLRKAPEHYDLGTSKFFGAPTIPSHWSEDFVDDVFFLCQLRLEQLKELDPENQLPHQGYLYVFLRVEEYGPPYRADVRFYNGEPDCAIDDFNGILPGYEQFCQAYIMEFSEVPRDAEGTKLFGVPADWPYGEDAPELFFQYDPLDNDTGFLSHMDGFMYLFFPEKKWDFPGISLHMEHS